MRFDLRRPCPECPFATTCPPGWLRRAPELADYMRRDHMTFPCHKTTGSLAAEQHCAGALILTAKTGTANAMQDLARWAGLYDSSRLDMAAPVFPTFEAFIAHHLNRTPVAYTRRINHE